MDGWRRWATVSVRCSEIIDADEHEEGERSLSRVEAEDCVVCAKRFDANLMISDADFDVKAVFDVMIEPSLGHGRGCLLPSTLAVIN
ncbi:UNVERIFIED_CONTAM: hypothetical protein K2H54_046728 [Gekko kuhli]